MRAGAPKSAPWLNNLEVKAYPNKTPGETLFDSVCGGAPLRHGDHAIRC